MEECMKPKSKYILKNTSKSILVIYTFLITMLITMLSTFVFATSQVSTTSDVTPPRGKFEFKDVIVSNNINYVDSVNVEVEVIAKDDSNGPIKYYLSSSEILDSAEIPEASWQTYTEGKTDIVVVPSMTELNTIYLVLKDEVGNTSLIYSGANVEYTVAYNANGGASLKSEVATKTYYGMPYTVTSQVPRREGYFFRGWSTNQNATTASYKKEDIIPANVFIGGSKTITLYAVWDKMGENNNKLADVVEVGDKVDLPLPYDNVNGSIYNGWRVISKDVDLEGNPSEGTVNLVSAGVPLTYYHYNNSSTSEIALTNNFLTTPFSETDNYTYRKNGFSLSKTLTETFTSPYVATNEDGTPKVRAMVAEDIYRITKHSNMETEYQMELNAIKYYHLFVNEANYWLASPEDGNDLWDVSGDGYVEGYNSNEYGIRPVVSLRKDVLTPGKNIFDEWEIKVSVPMPYATGTYTYTTNQQTLTINNLNQALMNVTGNQATNAGSYTATLSLRDTKNYYWADGTTAPKNLNWTIGQRDIGLVTIEAITNQTWLGGALTPVPTVIDGSNTLVNNTDFTISYSDNNAIGTGTVTLTGKGNYKGTNSATFTIDAAIITVTLDQQSGTGGTTSIQATYAKAMPSITVPSRAAYTFGGYYTGTNGSGTQYYKADGSGTQNWDKLVETTLYAKWTANTFTVTATAGAGGSISPNGTTTLNSGASQEFKITANSGYAIDGVVVDGTSVGIISSVTISNITANHTISVTFKQIPTSSLGYNGGSQIYTAQAKGVYKLEVWGAGGINDGAGGGSGGYSVGYVILEKGQKLYVTIGGAGSGTKYNGGGPNGGGGATHIASASGTLMNLGAANLSKIYIIAGGGGGGGTKTESWGLVRGYNGGNGGGLSGTDGGGDPSYGIASGATQTSGAGFGGASSGKGGGGLYGGVSGGQAGGGGSGYIGGVPQFEYNGTTYSPSSTAGGGSGAQSNGSAKITFITTVTDDFTFIAPTPYACSNSVQTYKVPATGLYKIEAKGAGGGADGFNGMVIGNPAGGSGGYSVGYVKLTAGQTIYVVVGGSGSGSRYNGGGSPGGGGATHVAYVSGTLAEIGSTSNVLLVAGGGGGGKIHGQSGGYAYGYTGGAGGGASGGNGERDPSYTQGIGGTSNSGYAFGKGGDGTGGGGGGLYGGTGGGGGAAGGGGSGYIGGVPAITYNGTTYSPSTTTGGGSPTGADGQVIISFIG